MAYPAGVRPRLRHELPGLLGLCLAAQGCVATTSVMRPTQDAHLSCPERLTLGKKFEQRGADADALKTYEPCLESYPEAVALLGRRYAPARDLLQRRKEALTDEVIHFLERGEDPPAGDVTLLVAVNWGLDQRADNIALFDRAAGTPAALNTAQALHGFVWVDLVKAGRYADALRWEQAVQESIDGSFLMAKVTHGEQSHDPSVRRALEEAALYARALAGSKRSADATHVFERALALDPGPSTYAQFIVNVATGGDSDLAKWIRDRASETLRADEMQTVDDALARTKGGF